MNAQGLRVVGRPTSEPSAETLVDTPRPRGSPLVIELESAMDAGVLARGGACPSHYPAKRTLDISIPILRDAEPGYRSRDNDNIAINPNTCRAEVSLRVAGPSLAGGFFLP